MQGPTMSAKFVIICLSHSSAFADSLYSSHCWPRATEDMHCAGYFHSFCLLWSFMKFYLNFPWLNISMRVSFQTLLTKECVCQKFWRFCISPRLLHQLGKGNCKKTNHSLNMKQKQWLLAILCLYHFFLSNLINVDGLGVSVTLTV